MMLAMSAFSPGQLELAGYTALVCIPQFVLPFLLGLFFIRKAQWLADKILSRAGHIEDQDKQAVNVDYTALPWFSLLGLYMLSTTIPDALRLLAAWFQAKAAETQLYSGISSQGFVQERFPEIVYHVAAIGFATFVFLQGMSVSRFVLSLRKG